MRALFAQPRRRSIFAERRLNLGHGRAAVCLALPEEALLMGAKTRDPRLDFVLVFAAAGRPARLDQLWRLSASELLGPHWPHGRPGWISLGGSALAIVSASIASMSGRVGAVGRIGAAAGSFSASGLLPVTD